MRPIFKMINVASAAHASTFLLGKLLAQERNKGSLSIEGEDGREGYELEEGAGKCAAGFSARGK